MREGSRRQRGRQGGGFQWAADWRRPVFSFDQGGVWSSADRASASGRADLVLQETTVLSPARWTTLVIRLHRRRPQAGLPSPSGHRCVSIRVVLRSQQGRGPRARDASSVFIRIVFRGDQAPLMSGENRSSGPIDLVLRAHRARTPGAADLSSRGFRLVFGRSLPQSLETAVRSSLERNFGYCLRQTRFMPAEGRPSATGGASQSPAWTRRDHGRAPSGCQRGASHRRRTMGLLARWGRGREACASA